MLNKTQEELFKDFCTMEGKFNTLGGIATFDWEEAALTKLDLLHHQIALGELFTAVIQWSNAVTQAYEEKILEENKCH